MWWNEYVGKPWVEGGRDSKGFDCWGLVRQVLIDQVNIELPKLENAVYKNGGDTRALLTAIKEYANSFDKGEWPMINKGEKAQEYDVVWLRNGGPIHFGVMIDKKRFIHVEEGCDSVIESIESPRWERKVRGYFRHESRY